VGVVAGAFQARVKRNVADWRVIYISSGTRCQIRCAGCTRPYENCVVSVFNILYGMVSGLLRGLEVQVVRVNKDESESGPLYRRKIKYLIVTVTYCCL